jgi:ABC-type antimicrobial peptide transport system permease subunit
VGVAKDLGITSVTSRNRDPGIYLPADLGRSGPMYMAVHVKGDPLSFVPRVRAVAAAVDPALRLAELQRLNEVSNGVLWFLRLWIRITLGLTAMALLLSLAGIYAVMSFTVARRTREIGIRVALGASARAMVMSIFRKPLTQVSVGVALGSVLAGLVMLTEMGGGTISATGIGLMLVYGLVILGVCLLACVVPTRRALSVEPMEALRVE